MCVCRCFCAFDVHVLMNCRYKETAVRGWNCSPNCRQGCFPCAEASYAALHLIALLLFGSAQDFSRLRACSNCTPIIFRLVSYCAAITKRLRRNKSAFSEINGNVKAWERLFSGHAWGLGHVRPPPRCGIHVRWVLTWHARYEMVWTAEVKPHPVHNSTSSFSTYSTSCVCLHLRCDLAVLFLHHDSAQEGENVMPPCFKGSKTGWMECGKNCSYLKIICDGLRHFPTYLVTAGPRIGCFFPLWLLLVIFCP